jgi:alanyl-tRNA synthetase
MEVEIIVNEKINEFLPVLCQEMSMDEATAAGAMGLFEDKYGDVVRVVSVGDFSRELCGGIHVANSGQIGSFKILSESGIASGVRRIEAVTGAGLLNQLKEKETVLNEVAALIKAKPNAIVEKLASLLEENKEVKRELESLKKQSLNNASEELINEAKEINGVKLITKQFADTDVNDLRTISDELKAKYDNLALVFATVNGPKVTLLVSLTKDVVEKGYHAGNMIKEIAKAAGGGGGGKPDMAQAGAKDADKLPEAFKVAEGLL